jgi:hypothetical protein
MVFATLHKEHQANMALSPETTFDPSTADLINLREILEACIYVPDISDVSQQPKLSREQRFCIALDHFESTTKVFDQAYYETEVLHIGTTEEELDERLLQEARDVGVPESHFPIAKRRRIHRLSKQQSHLRQSVLIDSTTERMISTEPPRSSSTHNRSLLSMPAQRASISSRPSLSAPPLDRATARQSTLSTQTTPTPAASIVSFKTTSSQSSSFSNRIFGKRRDSGHGLRQFFRRDSSRASSVSTENYPLSPTESSLAYSRNQHTIAEEEPDVTSSQSHESQDLSSIQSLSISSMTSVSSFGDQQPYQDLSGIDKDSMERFIHSKPFLQLRISCQEEIQRFNSFATNQHVALPLIHGRNHLYYQERKQVRLTELQKEVSTVVTWNVKHVHSCYD